ncbi:MAG: hypothetical protein JXP73_20245 [Deltaproteobacteria bacterium]|nr:hypothetical protein [Deltaproteobacteria bacterium]
MAIVVETSINEAQGSVSGAAGPGKEPSSERRDRARHRLRTWLLSVRVPDVWCFAAGYVLLLPFFVAPLFATRLLPGLDLPFHLAAADMLSKVGHPSSPYAPFYEGGLRVAPYAAHFVALVALAKVMNLLAAHKLIMVLYVAGLPLAMASLLAACRRSRIPALLAFPLAYNLTVHYGFISFALSLPVVLWLLAEMTKLVWSESRRSFRARWLVTAGVATLLFLCHLQNFLFGVCAAFAFALFATAPLRRKLLAAATLLPAFAGLAYWHLGSPPVSGQAKLTFSLAWKYLKSHRLDDIGPISILSDLWQRIEILPTHALRGFVDQSHVPACQALVLVVAAYFGIGLLASLAASAEVDALAPRRRRMRLAGMIAFVGALAAYLALPHHLQELELMTFFPRFSVLVLLMSLLLVPAGLLRFRGLLRLALPLPALVLGVLYGHQLYAHYRAYGTEVAGFVAVAERTPPGGRAMGLIFDRKSKVVQVESALVGLAGFYPALRPALGSMVPPAYCGLRHMPCRLKKSTDAIISPWAPQSFSPAKMLPTFDYYFVHSAPAGHDPWRGYHGMFALLAQSGTWAVFGKRPGPVVPDPPPMPVPAPVSVPPPPPAPAEAGRKAGMRKALPSAAASRKLAAPSARR